MLTADPKAIERYNALKAIHKSVYDRFVYSSDERVWNKSEHWENYNQIPDEGYIYGDCDCFALACRKECRKQNIPSRLVFCAVNVNGEWIGHLVLESDGWILENNQTTIKPSQDIDYAWLYISGYERGDPWRYIEDYDPDIYAAAMGEKK